MPCPSSPSISTLDSAVGTTSGTALSIAGSTASGSIAPQPPEVVAITDTAAFGSSDPIGLAYVPGLDTLFIADPQGIEPCEQPVRAEP